MFAGAGADVIFTRMVDWLDGCGGDDHSVCADVVETEQVNSRHVAQTREIHADTQMHTQRRFRAVEKMICLKKK